MGESSGGYGPLGHGAPVGRRGAHGAGSADGGCHDAPYYRTRGVTRGMRKGESELGVENSAIASWRLLKNKSLSLSVHFYIVLPATLNSLLSHRKDPHGCLISLQRHFQNIRA